MMGQLERRAEAISGEFKPDEVAMTLWACHYGTKLEYAIEEGAEAISGVMDERDFAAVLWAIGRLRSLRAYKCHHSR